MKHIILILSIIFLSIKTSNSQSGWYKQESGVNTGLISIAFLNINTGVVVGTYGKILMTRNGGLNWDTVHSPTTSHLLSVCILDSNTILATGMGRTVIKTTNCGSNWYRIVNIFNGFDLNEINFPDKFTGYIASSEGVILKSINSGESWFELNHPEPFAWSFNSLSFVDANTGYVVGYMGFSPRSPILRTTNGGSNWIRQESSTQSSLNSVEFIDANTGIICGSFGIIRRTTNGGINWDLIINAPINTFLDLSFINSKVAFIVGGNGTIIKTTDGGINWIQQFSGTPRHLSGIYFMDELTGYVVGDSGTILKTTTGGIVGINLTNNIIPEKFYLHQNYPNPFNPRTKIKFDVPPEARRKQQDIRLTVYDIRGRKVKTLVNENLSAGEYEVEFEGSNLSSGIYYYKLETGNFIATKKMILIK